MENRKIKMIGLTKETESPENPEGLEKRVALIPHHIERLVKNGFSLFVEEGVGEGIGFSDKEYQNVGALIQSEEDIYKNKDLIIKFKGPALSNIKKMDKGTILFCMAHFRSFPERARLLEDCKINVIAMEEILESPKFIADEIILSKRFVEEKLSVHKSPYGELDVGFLGYHETMIGGIRRVGNRSPQTLTLYQKTVEFDELKGVGEKALYFYDSRFFSNVDLLKKLKSLSCEIHDFKNFKEVRGVLAIDEYRNSHEPFKLGGRRIQCLHETGMAGARYGFKLLRSMGKEKSIQVSVLGYGNVGMGAIRECYDQGVRTINVLGRKQTEAENIGSFLKNSQLIINGAEQPAELRGKNFLIKQDHIGKVILKGSVVIDLVGGSVSNRSPVEDIIECSYLTNPHFSRNGVTFSALWGWPMMGMMKESAIKYSGQILGVLIGKENLLAGLNELGPGLKRALVCGPYLKNS